MTPVAAPPNVDTWSARLPLLLHALAFAAAKHRDQRRKDLEASPYINHPIALVRILVEEGAVTDVDTLCAALLHDTIEDTETTEAELRATFGDTISAIVCEVTDDKRLPKHVRKQAQVDGARSLSLAARRVKLADKIANLRDLTVSAPVDWDQARIRAYFDWAKAVIDGLRGDNPALEAAFDAIYALRP